MASLFKRRKQYWVSFYLDGKHVRRSLKTTNERVAKAIEEMMGESDKDETAPAIITSARKCPHCNQPMRREAGCFICDKCSFRAINV
jgi:hypothetical protein